jgi:hypothetical protein
MTPKKATITETTYRKRRNGIIYRALFINYADGSGERILIPTATHHENN